MRTEILPIRARILQKNVLRVAMLLVTGLADMNISVLETILWMVIGAAVATALHIPDWASNSTPEYKLEPNGSYQTLDFKCNYWNTKRSENFVGISPKVWLCDNGIVMHDKSGVRFPTVEEEENEAE